MLTQEERQLVIELLVADAAIAPVPRVFLIAGVYGHLRDRVGDGTPRALVETVVSLCSDDRPHRSPPAIVHLLDTLLPQRAEVAAIVARLRVPPVAPPDPFQARILSSNLPFLDRPHTRQALQHFLQQTPLQPVVVINGPRGFGKSYTGEFIDHVLCGNPGLRHCRIELSETQGRTTGPRELAMDMVTMMGGRPDEAPELNTNLDRAAQDLANWVISVANNSNRNWWFLLDGFNPGELRTDTRLLIVKLATGLTTGIARERHRLVLADFDRATLPLRPGLIAVENTAPIPHASVAAVVADLVPAGSPLDANALTAKVLEGLTDPVTNLPELSQRLCDLIVTLEFPPVAQGVGS